MTMSAPSSSQVPAAGSVPERICLEVGQPLTAGAREDRKDGINRDGGGRLTLRLYELNKPIIAAINGAAVGVGVTMTLAMDIRLRLLPPSSASYSPGEASCRKPAPAIFYPALLASARP